MPRNTINVINSIIKLCITGKWTKSSNVFSSEHNYRTNQQQIRAIFYSPKTHFNQWLSCCSALQIYHRDVFIRPQTALLNNAKATAVNKPLCVCGYLLTLKCSPRCMQRDTLEEYEEFVFIRVPGHGLPFSVLYSVWCWSTKLMSQTKPVLKITPLLP